MPTRSKMPRKTPRKPSKKKAPRRASAKQAVALPADWQPPCSEEAVRKGTGRGWQQWIERIGAAGGAGMSHREIAAMLHAKHRVGGWWAQTVTVGYERATGRRALHQKKDGYSMSLSRTLAAGRGEVFDAWQEPARRKRWMKEPLAAHRATRPKSLRLTWTDGAKSIAVNLYAVKGGRTRLQLQHGRLGSEAEVQRMKKWWAARLDALAKALAAARPAD